MGDGTKRENSITERLNGMLSSKYAVERGRNAARDVDIVGVRQVIDSCGLTATWFVWCLLLAFFSATAIQGKGVSSHLERAAEMTDVVCAIYSTPVF